MSNKKSNLQLKPSDYERELNNQNNCNENQNGQKQMKCKSASNSKGAREKMKPPTPSTDNCDAIQQLRHKLGINCQGTNSSHLTTNEQTEESVNDNESAQTRDNLSISQPVTTAETTTTTDSWFPSSVKQMGQAIISILKPTGNPIASAIDGAICKELDNKTKRMQRKRKREDISPEPRPCDDIEVGAPLGMFCHSEALDLLPFDDGAIINCALLSQLSSKDCGLSDSVEMKNEDIIDACENCVRGLKLTNIIDERVPYYMPAGQKDGHAHTQAIVQDLTTYHQRLATVQKRCPLLR